jgi:copper(I)-binding protein
MKRWCALGFVAAACVGAGVVYATLRNPGTVPDRLVGASSPIARAIELDVSETMKMPAMNVGTMPMPPGSMTSMKAVRSIPVPAGGTTMLAPGGYHLMLDLRRDLAAGATIPLRLHQSNSVADSNASGVRPDTVRAARPARESCPSRRRPRTVR